MSDIVEKIIWCYEEEYSITLSEMYSRFNRLIFELPTIDSSEKLFEKIPLKYKSDYYNYLVNTFDNNTPANLFISVGSVTRLIPLSKQELKKEKLKGIEQIENIRRFLSGRREK
jgi:ERCC4-type nuclease